nr:hypothetical protein [Moritella viscosa]
MIRIGHKVMPFKEGSENIIRSGANSRIEILLKDIINSGKMEMGRKWYLFNAS